MYLNIVKISEQDKRKQKILTYAIYWRIINVLNKTLRAARQAK